MKSKIKVWIIDDETEFCKKFSLLLRKINFVSAVCSFGTGEEAIGRLRLLSAEEYPAALFIDVYLTGGKDGLGIVSELERLGIRIPCILISETNRAKIVRDAAVTRATLFMHKHHPSDPNWADWEKDVEANLNFALSKSASYE